MGDGRGACRRGGGSQEGGGTACKQFTLGKLSRLYERSGFEGKGRFKTQVGGGSTVGGKKTSRRRQGRDPNTVMEPNQASYISMLT